MNVKITKVITDWLTSHGLEVPEGMFVAPTDANMIESQYLHGVELVLLHEGCSETHAAISMDGAYQYGAGYDMYDKFVAMLDGYGLSVCQIYGWASEIRVNDYYKDNLKNLIDLEI